MAFLIQKIEYFTKMLLLLLHEACNVNKKIGTYVA